ncbi:MAG: glycosyltransferase family 2 protein [Chitinispirillales bacterium]|nr:glycosyltransferase family 2 protein [Chitinispirillales bacterium]
MRIPTSLPTPQLDRKNVRCTVIVVTYNGKKEWYDKCFSSLLTSSIPLEIIVVDNKSTDDTIDYISRNFQQIKIIQNDENVGFAKANNIGLNIAYNDNKDYFFLLNQDAWVEHNTLEILITVAEKKQEFGIFSPIHLTGSKSGFDKNFRNYFHYNSTTICAYECLYLKYQQPILYESFFVNAAAWLITRKCVEIVGGFDTIMFKHYGEDNNYCQRVIYHKLKIGIVPTTTICHDRAFRANNPLDPDIIFSITYGNILLTKKILKERLIEIFFKIIRGKEISKGLKEIRFVIKKYQKIVKSREINKIKGKGLEYLEIKEI